jgi:hypothetical protein
MTGWNYVGGRVDLLGDVISGIERQRKCNNLEKGKNTLESQMNISSL